MSDPEELELAERPVVPTSLAQVSRAQHIEPHLVASLEQLAADPSTSLRPEEVPRFAQLMSQALAADPGFFARFKQKLGFLDWAMIVASATGIRATWALFETGASWDACGAGIASAVLASTPVIKVFFPNFGMALEKFFRRNP